jgi:hypothetical protein
MRKLSSWLFIFAAVTALLVALTAPVAANLNSSSVRAAPVAVASGADLGQPFGGPAIEQITAVSLRNTLGVSVIDRDVGTFILSNNAANVGTMSDAAKSWQQYSVNMTNGANLYLSNGCRIDRDVGTTNNLTNGNAGMVTITENTTARTMLHQITINQINLTVNRENVLTTRVIVVLRV